MLPAEVREQGAESSEQRVLAEGEKIIIGCGLWCLERRRTISTILACVEKQDSGVEATLKNKRQNMLHSRAVD